MEIHWHIFSYRFSSSLHKDLQIFGILSWCMQEMRKLQNLDLRTDLAWSINCGKMESNPRDFPGFRRLRAAANSSGLRGSEILRPSGVGIFHRSDSCLLTSLVGSRSLVLCVPFFTSCKGDGVFRVRANAGRVSRPASKLVDCSSRLAAGVREVDGVDSFLPSLLCYGFIKT